MSRTIQLSLIVAIVIVGVMFEQLGLSAGPGINILRTQAQVCYYLNATISIMPLRIKAI